MKWPWAKKLPVEERLDHLEAALTEQQSAIMAAVRSIALLTRTLNDVIDAHGASSLDDLSVSVALTKRLFGVEEDVNALLDLVAGLGVDVTVMKSMHTELLTKLRAREHANSGSLDLPAVTSKRDAGSN